MVVKPLKRQQPRTNDAKALLDSDPLRAKARAESYASTTTHSPSITTQHYEILLRLRGEDGAIISPGEFLPAAERYGLAPSFDRWVVRNVFAYLDAHPEDEASYALNLSGRSLSDPGTAEFILDEICQYHFDPARISFEVTETAAIDSLDACERLILKLQSRGIQFALDDFGKGQSSFGYLKRLPVTQLKIDGDFVRGMDHDREKFAIVKAMHTLAHELGKQTIAEQVETEAELSCLKKLGVDFVQGYLLHRPAPLLGGVIPMRQAGSAVACPSN